MQQLVCSEFVAAHLCVCSRIPHGIAGQITYFQESRSISMYSSVLVEANDLLTTAQRLHLLRPPLLP
jgi:hypothetical protein